MFRCLRQRLGLRSSTSIIWSVLEMRKLETNDHHTAWESKHWRTLGWSCSNTSPAGRSFHEWETPWKWDSSTVCRGLLLPYLGSNPTIEMKKVIKVWQVFMFSVIHNNLIQSRLCVSHSALVTGGFVLPSCEILLCFDVHCHKSIPG